MDAGSAPEAKPGVLLRARNRLGDVARRAAAQVRGPRARRELPRTLMALASFLATVALMTAAQVWGDRVFVLRVLGPRLVPEAAVQFEGQSADWAALTCARQSSAHMGSRWIDNNGTSMAIPTPSGTITATSRTHPSAFAVMDHDLQRNPPMAGPDVEAQSHISAAFNPIGQYAMEPLYDAVIDLLPDLAALRGWLPDLLLTTHIAAVVLLALVFPQRAYGLGTRLLILRRFLITQTTLYALRTALILCTTVPSPVPACVPPVASSLADQLLLMGRMARGSLTGCTDNIYSAHTALATNLLLFALLHCGRVLQGVFHVAHWLALLAAILATRLHYTVDVVLAAVVTLGVFGLYHLLLLVAVLCSTSGDAHGQKEVRRALSAVPRSLVLAVSWLDGYDLRREDAPDVEAGQPGVSVANPQVEEDTCASQKTVAVSTHVSDV